MYAPRFSKKPCSTRTPRSGSCVSAPGAVGQVLQPNTMHSSCDDADDDADEDDPWVAHESLSINLLQTLTVKNLKHKIIDLKFPKPRRSMKKATWSSYSGIMKWIRCKKLLETPGKSSRKPKQARKSRAAGYSIVAIIICLLLIGILKQVAPR